MARYSDKSDQWDSPEWPGPDSQAHAVSGWTKPPKRPKWPWILGAVVLLSCGLGLPLSLAMSDNPAPRGVAGQAEVPEAKVTPKPSPQPTPTAIRDGQWSVGTEVKAGTYRTSGAEKSILGTICTWMVYANDGGAFLDGGAVEKVDSPGRVVLKKGQVFHTTGCKPWRRVAG